MSSAEDFGSPEDFESEEIGVTVKTSIFMWGIWSVKTFVFIVSFSLSWVIGTTVLLKGVEVILKKLISMWCSSQNPTPTQSFEWSHWKSHISSVNFFSDRDEDLLVFEEFVLTEELGICQCGLPTSEEHDSPEDFDSQNSDHCCAMRQRFQNIYPPNDHIRQGHLCLIMSGYSLCYK